MSPLFIIQGSVERSLGIFVHQVVDLILEAMPPATYLHLLVYLDLFMVLIVLKSK